MDKRKRSRMKPRKEAGRQRRRQRQADHRDLALAQARIKETYLALIYNNVCDVIFSLDILDDEHFRFSSINRRFLDTTGLKESDVIGKDIKEVIPPSSHALVLQKYREAMHTGRAVSWEEISEYPSGRKVGEVTVAPVFDQQGNCTNLVGTVHDVTERGLAQQLLQETEERWRLALEGSGAGVWDWNIQSGGVKLSRQWKLILGYAEDEIADTYDAWESRVHPEDKPKVLASLQQALNAPPSSFSQEHRLRGKNGGWVWVHGHGMISRDGSGRAVRMIGTISDITKRKNAEEMLQLTSLAYHNSSEAMVVTDADGIVLTVNPAFCKIRGYAEDEVIGKPSATFFSELHDAGFYRSMWDAINTTGRWKGEIWNHRKDGEVIAEMHTIDTIYNENGTVRRRVDLFSDITKKKESEEMIWRQANLDTLTGLPNRQLFLDRLGQAVRRAYRAGLPVTLLFIDLDHFKEINDNFGHNVGDVLLRDAAQRLLSCVRKMDTVARLGGDEFTVILSELHNAQSVERIAQEILHKMAAPFRLEHSVVHISASVGITTYPKDTTNINDLLKHADQAMYSAKHQGRNRYCYFLPDMQEKAQLRRHMINDLHHAIASQQFRLYYQPIVNLANMKIIKAEALMRWEHATRGIIGPAEFIPLCEETGMILDIGDWVFQEAIEQAAHWRATYNPEFQISINVSPVQLHSPDWGCAEWLPHLQHLHLPGQSTVLEITEGMLLQAGTIVEDKLHTLINAGIEISLDDFGTGYSSLSYIKKFQFHYLKIDQSFVHNIAVGSCDLALCETIITMAHKLGMKVIAEGVETDDQLNLLLAAGCDYGQGNLFSAPLPSSGFELLMKHFECEAGHL